ncbi:MATE family efflux transporter [Kushneria phosphatilytica]|uniref:MATE family efflux transporter n=1 Tax=Kushneria phosphatilytica TaxID=657387 RepID=A0A1S1NTC8_9GAMM|nr:MATE family efflux transporter [Kushneria phosphatilytica]OHV08845.1 MATE family efflux transporter [Kushneria phosphatilytica]QEL12922.1 MATE family efflux transporter [Kushneria phosphatilytica]
MIRALWHQTLPMAMGVAALLGFNLIDSIFIARLGTRPLAAQSFTFPVATVIIGVQVGFGIAIAALISRALGGEEEARARRLSTLLLFGCSAFMLGLMVLLYLLAPVIFTLLGADRELLPLIYSYWGPWLMSSWLGALLYLGYSLFRAHGETRLPGRMMVLTSLLNLCLDPLFIFGFGDFGGWGLPGAAWATLLSFFIGVLILGRLPARRGWLSFTGLREEARVSTRRFLGIALPAMTSQLLPAASALVATGVVARLGETAVAAWGLAARLETFVILVVLGMTMSLPPWLGRCYGAGRWGEIRQLMNLAARVVLIWQCLLGIVLALLASPLAGLLAGNAEVRELLTTLLRFLLPSYALLGICMLIVSACNALGWPRRAVMVSFMRLFVCYLPCLIVGSWLGGFVGLAAGAGVGNLLAGALAWWSYRRALGSRGKHDEHEERRVDPA